jgi:hypothetical protein
MSSEPTFIALPDVSELLELQIIRVHQLIRDRQLLSVRRNGVRVVPSEFIKDGLVVKSLAGVITLLADAGYDDEESIEWLFRSDDTLPGRPIDALRDNRGTEIKRRAQAAGF